MTVLESTTGARRLANISAYCVRHALDTDVLERSPLRTKPTRGVVEARRWRRRRCGTRRAATRRSARGTPRRRLVRAALEHMREPRRGRQARRWSTTMSTRARSPSIVPRESLAVPTRVPGASRRVGLLQRPAAARRRPSRRSRTTPRACSAARCWSDCAVGERQVGERDCARWRCAASTSATPAPSSRRSRRTRRRRRRSGACRPNSWTPRPRSDVGGEVPRSGDADRARARAASRRPARRRRTRSARGAGRRARCVPGEAAPDRRLVDRVARRQPGRRPAAGRGSSSARAAGSTASGQAASPDRRPRDGRRLGVAGARAPPPACRGAVLLELLVLPFEEEDLVARFLPCVRWLMMLPSTSAVSSDDQQRRADSR